MYASPSKYTSLSGSPLPLFHHQGSGRGLVRQKSGAGRASSRRLVAAAGAASLCLCVLTIASCRTLSEQGDARDALVRSVSAAPVMSDADALLAMYPANQPAVPQLSEAAAAACASRYTLLLVADRDQDAHNASAAEWRSSLRRGSLCRLRNGSFAVTWLDEVELSSALALGGRGMELSELAWFNSRLLSCDDRTGILFQIEGGLAIPRHILAESTGPNAGHGFKCEWAAVRHGSLYVGGIGRPWIDRNGRTRSSNDQVSVLEASGEMQLQNWSGTYEAMRAAAGVAPDGYLTHEAALWDDSTDRWLFAPRRASTEPHDEALDERRGTNLLLSLSGKAGSRVKVVRTGGEGSASSPRGYSSIRLLPGSADELVAIKTEELQGHVASYLSVVRSKDGVLLMPETRIANAKYEGLEIAI